MTVQSSTAHVMANLYTCFLQSGMKQRKILNIQNGLRFKQPKNPTFAKLSFIRNVFNAYMNFKDYFENDTLPHDHTILWPILCYPGVVWNSGLDLYLFELIPNHAEDDIDKTQYICPPNGESFYYHYDKINNEDAKTAFATFRRVDGMLQYEPCVRIYVTNKGKLAKKNTEILFSGEEVLPSVAPLRNNCGQIFHNKYVKYLRENKYQRIPLIYEETKKILNNLNLKPYGQVLSNYQVKGIMVNNFYLPIYAHEIILEDELELYEKIPCNVLKGFDESYAFYKKLSDKGIRCMPLEYTIDRVSKKVNGFILETDSFVPIKPEAKQTHFHNLKESLRPNYECFEASTLTSDAREHYIREFKDFWLDYDVFCLEVAKSIQKSTHKINNKNALNLIKKHSSELLKTQKHHTFLELLLKEYEYNFTRKRDVDTATIPMYMDSLEENKEDDTSKIFSISDIDFYIKNVTNKNNFETYIPYHHTNNSNIVYDREQYTKTSHGVNLPKTWQNRLLRDFKYSFDNKYKWMELQKAHLKKS